MKKKSILITAFILTSFLLTTALPVAATTGAARAKPTKEELLLRTKLLKVKGKQNAAKVQINRNVTKVKSVIKRVKYNRAIEKKKRTVIKNRAQQKVLKTTPKK